MDILSYASRRCWHGHRENVKIICWVRARCQSVSRCPSGHWGSTACLSSAIPQVQSRQVSAWLMMHTVAGRDDQSASLSATCLHDPDCHYEMYPMYSELPFDCLLPPTCQQYLQAAHQYHPPVNSIHVTWLCWTYDPKLLLHPELNITILITYMWWKSVLGCMCE